MIWLSRFKRQAPPKPVTDSAPQPDHAWKALSITNEWIRHADTKTGVTLAFVATTATVLFNLVKGETSWTCLQAIATSACALCITVASLFACAALFPRTRSRSAESTDEDAVNLLFFGDIAGHYSKDRPSYLQVLSLLTSNPSRLTRQIAAQIHENSHIATEKFKHVNRAIITEVLAFVAVVAVAIITTGGW